MEKRTNPTARALAVAALVGAAIVVVIVAGSLGGDSGSSVTTGRHGSHHPVTKQRQTTTASSYVIQTGDTLIAIAHKTGVPVARIIELNPEVDPQILTAGEKLKLR